MSGDNPKDWQRDETPVMLLSPLQDTLPIEYYNDENVPETINIHPQEIVTFPKYKADVIKKRIVDQIINERGIGFITPEQRTKLDQEVVVELYG